jgi:hypothetical protein
MKKQDFCNFLESKGWMLDRFGHYKKTVTLQRSGQRMEILHRVKMLKTCARLEKRASHSECGWYLVARSYFKNIRLNVEQTHYEFSTVRFKA